jgi:integrase
MKGQVRRRWIYQHEEASRGCRHEWVAASKERERCANCPSRRTKAKTWVWQHEVTRNGRKAFVSGTKRTKEEAQAALTESLAKHASGQQVEPNRITVETFLNDWLAEVRPRLKAGTYRSYSDIVEHRLTPHLGNVRLRDLRAAQIAHCYSELRMSGRRNGEGGLSETSLEHSHRVLHAALEHAARSRLIPRNVCDDVVKPKRVHTEMKTWTAKELTAFLTATADDRLHPLWVTAATTALRRGELLGLRWSDLDLDHARLAVRRSRTSVGYEVIEDAPKSKRSVRTVDLDPETVAILKRWRKAQKEERLAWGAGWVDTGLVFTREDGIGLHPHAVSDAFDAAVKRSKAPKIRLHDLRHTWATVTLRAGMSPKIVFDRLGHASVGFTLDTYAHATPGWGAEAASVFAGLVFGNG